MRCAVLNCSNCNANKASNLSFFQFPSNEALLKKWISFSRRGNSFNSKTAHICMEHFSDDDFENNLKYKMGYTKKRALKCGAFPTINKATVGNLILHQQRAKRIQRRDNKKTVTALLQESSYKKGNKETRLFEKSANDDHLFEHILLQESNYKEKHGSMNSFKVVAEAAVSNQDPIALMDILKNESEEDNNETELSEESENGDHLFEHIERLQKKIETLKQENVRLRNAKKEDAIELSTLKQNWAQAEKKHLYDIHVLKDRLIKAKHENKNIKEKLITILREEQLGKLKNDTKRCDES